MGQQTISGDDRTYYQMLGIEEHATSTEIKKSYYKLVLTCHPDKLSPEDSQKEAKEEEFKKISEAYEVLSDPNRREMYDGYLDDNITMPFSGYEARNRSAHKEASGSDLEKAATLSSIFSILKELNEFNLDQYDSSIHSNHFNYLLAPSLSDNCVVLMITANRRYSSKLSDFTSDQFIEALNSFFTPLDYDIKFSKLPASSPSKTFRGQWIYLKVSINDLNVLQENLDILRRRRADDCPDDIVEELLQSEIEELLDYRALTSSSPLDPMAAQFGEFLQIASFQATDISDKRKLLATAQAANKAMQTNNIGDWTQLDRTIDELPQALKNTKIPEDKSTKPVNTMWRRAKAKWNTLGKWGKGFVIAGTIVTTLATGLVAGIIIGGVAAAMKASDALANKGKSDKQTPEVDDITLSQCGVNLYNQACGNARRSTRQRTKAATEPHDRQPLHVNSPMLTVNE